ncbi:MAG: hypothetical protein ACRDE2_10110 [Chitinophagaceae bacterium]
MAQQCGPLLISKTIDNVCFYRMEGKYYVRMKSSLTRKRVLKDPKFQLTRVHAATLGKASTIASQIYRQISGERKIHTLYREITGKAIYLLREGKDDETVFQSLSRQYLKPEPVQVAEESVKKEVVNEPKLYDWKRRGLTVPELRKSFADTDTFFLSGRRRRIRFMDRDGWKKRYDLGP